MEEKAGTYGRAGLVSSGASAAEELAIAISLSIIERMAVSESFVENYSVLSIIFFHRIY